MKDSWNLRALIGLCRIEMSSRDTCTVSASALIGLCRIEITVPAGSGYTLGCFNRTL